MEVCRSPGGLWSGEPPLKDHLDRGEGRGRKSDKFIETGKKLTVDLQSLPPHPVVCWSASSAVYRQCVTEG